MRGKQVLTMDTIIDERVFIFSSSFSRFCKKFGIEEDVNDYLQQFRRIGISMKNKRIRTMDNPSFTANNYYKRYYLIKLIAYKNIGIDFPVNYFHFMYGCSSKFENPIKNFSLKKERINSLVNEAETYFQKSSAVFVTMKFDDIFTKHKQSFGDKEKKLFSHEKSKFLKYIRKEVGEAYMYGFELVGGLDPHYHFVFLSAKSSEDVMKKITSYNQSFHTKILYKKTKNNTNKIPREQLTAIEKIEILGLTYDYITKIAKIKQGEKFAKASIIEKVSNVNTSKGIRTWGQTRRKKKNHKSTFLFLIKWCLDNKGIYNIGGKCFEKLLYIIIKKDLWFDKRIAIFFFFIFYEWL